jgi:hypothetical protein
LNPEQSLPFFFFLVKEQRFIKHREQEGVFKKG